MAAELSREGKTAAMREVWRRAAGRGCGVAVAALVSAGVLLAQGSGKPVTGVPAAQPGSLGLDAVLERLEQNLTEYRHTVPDLSCSEHVVSSLDEGRVRTATVTDSTFRLRKQVGDDGLVEFDESRVVKAIDGKVPLSEAEGLSGPALLSGVFSDGLQVVSKELRGCFRYTLRPVRSRHPREKLLVEFRDVPRSERQIECPPFEGTYGLATIDPVSLHVLRLEKTTPDPDRFRGRMAVWKWTVQYAPVPLAGRMFWMPQKIRSTSRTDDGMFVWEFDGTYKGYHLFRAESKIVPIAP